jgi:hypothetical protein
MGLMSDPNSTVGERDHLQVLATTGHETLKGFLLVSSGSVAIFLAFFGSAIGSERIMEILDATSIERLVRALFCFMLSVLMCMASFGFSFIGHACYYKKRKHLGDRATVVAFLFGLACMGCLFLGGWWTVAGIRDAFKKPVTQPAALVKPALRN